MCWAVVGEIGSVSMSRMISGGWLVILAEVVALVTQRLQDSSQVCMICHKHDSG